MNDSALTSALLVAMPQLRDPNFRRTVLLLVHHDDAGAFGLVLNRPLDLPAGDLCAGIECRWGGDPSTPVHWGGPVATNTGWVLFGQDLILDAENLEVTEVAKGVSFAGSMDVLRTIAESPPEDCRLFLGYAGWGPGQLEGELAEGAWLVAPLSSDVVFSVGSESMWEHVVRSLGVDPATLIASRGVH